MNHGMVMIDCFAIRARCVIVLPWAPHVHTCSLCQDAVNAALDVSLPGAVVNEFPTEVLLVQVCALLKCTTHGLVYQTSTWSKQGLDHNQPRELYITLLGLESFANKVTISKCSPKMLFVARDGKFD